ncbi:hypothetical protein ES707_11975 [subsurface metagenome]
MQVGGVRDDDAWCFPGTLAAVAAHGSGVNECVVLDDRRAAARWILVPVDGSVVVVLEEVVADLGAVDVPGCPEAGAAVVVANVLETTLFDDSSAGYLKPIAGLVPERDVLDRGAGYAQAHTTSGAFNEQVVRIGATKSVKIDLVCAGVIVVLSGGVKFLEHVVEIESPAVFVPWLDRDDALAGKIQHSGGVIVQDIPGLEPPAMAVPAHIGSVPVVV